MGIVDAELRDVIVEELGAFEWQTFEVDDIVKEWEDAKFPLDEEDRDLWSWFAVTGPLGASVARRLADAGLVASQASAIYEFDELTKRGRRPNVACLVAMVNDEIISVEEAAEIARATEALYGAGKASNIRPTFKFEGRLT